MLSLTGQVMNILETPTGTRKDGTEYGGFHQVQMLCEEHLTNGETRLGLFTLRCDDPGPFEKLKGRPVRVPIGAFARAGTIHYYLQAGAVPVLEVNSG